MRTGVRRGVRNRPRTLKTAEITRKSWRRTLLFLHQILVCTKPWFKRDLAIVSRLRYPNHNIAIATIFGWPRTALGCSPLGCLGIPQPRNSSVEKFLAGLSLQRWCQSQLRNSSVQRFLGSGIYQLRNSSGQGWPGIQGW